MVFEILQGIDSAFLFFVQSLHSPFLDTVFMALNFFGTPFPWFAVAAMAYWSGREKTSFHFMNALLFATLVVGATKIAVARPRPDPAQFRVLVNDFASSYSFPSGHAANAASFFGFLEKNLSANKKILFFLLVAGVMLARIYLGAHFLFDVVAGAIIGFALGKLAWNFREQLHKHHFRLSKLQDEFLLVATILVSLLALLFVEKTHVLAPMLGFYAGFFLFQELGLKQTKLEGKELLLKQIAGFAYLAALSFPLLSKNGFAESFPGFVLLFFAGFLVSFLFPFGFEKVFNRVLSTK